MGKGNKSKNERKDGRKEERDRLKKDKLLSKTPIEKLNHTSNSCGITRIFMTEEKEELLLKLMIMLESGNTNDELVTVLLESVVLDRYSESDDESSNELDIEFDDKASSHDEDDDSDNEEEEDDDTEVYLSKNGSEKITIPKFPISKLNLTDKQKRDLIRKLIRDDRRKNIDLVAKVNDDRLNRKAVVKQIFVGNNNTKVGKMSFDTVVNVVEDDCIDLSCVSPCLPIAAPSQAAGPVLKNAPIQQQILSKVQSSPVRIIISCENKAFSPKLFLVDCTWSAAASLDALLQAARNRFSVGKRYNALLVLPERRLLDAGTLSSLADGNRLLLASAFAASAPMPHTHTVVAARVGLNEEDTDSTEESSDTDDDTNRGSEDEVVYTTPDADVVSEEAVGAQLVSGEARVPEEIGDYDESKEIGGYDDSKEIGGYDDSKKIGGYDDSKKIGGYDDRKEDMQDILPSIEADGRTSAAMLAQQEAFFSSPLSVGLREHRRGLPIFRQRETLLAAIRQHQVVVVSGETGCGKTTQLPAYLLEDMIAAGRGSEALIICTQPRRLAAMSVAERVAYERGETVGCTIGSQVRLDSRCGPETRLLFCTTGVLLRRLQNPAFLSRVSHILVDEVHERQVETDFVMTLLKQQAPSYPQLRLVMMSATMQEGLFAQYFACPVVYVEGRAFPVQQHFLSDIHKLVAVRQRDVATARGKSGYGRLVPNGDDVRGERGSRGKGGGGRRGQGSAPTPSQPSEDTDESAPATAAHPKMKFDAEIVAEVVIRIMQTYGTRSCPAAAAPAGGIGLDAGIAETEHNEAASCSGDAVLVFLSGMQAIERISRALRQRGDFAACNAQVLVLHGSLPPEQQRRVFSRTRPGEWKIVLSTNIAETSVTVCDVTHVVDCGLLKELRYDPVGNISSLQEVAVTRASARQRAGRAGRVRPGHCWRLYSQEYLESDAVDDYPQPEIQRVPLENVVLQVLLLRLGSPEKFLAGCLQPPSIEQIRTSVNTLLDLKAILPSPSLPLTPLGVHLGRMPVDVRVGKMLITASILGCLDPALTIAAALAGKSPFFTPQHSRDEAYRAHLTFTSSHAFTAASAYYGVTVPQPSTELSNDYRVGQKDALTPENDVFFSDHLAVVQAYYLWAAVYRQRGLAAALAFCRDKFLSHATLEEMRKLRENFLRHMQQLGFAPAPGVEDNSLNPSLRATDGEAEDLQLFGGEAVGGRVGSYGALRCALFAGLYPQVVKAGRFQEAAKGQQRRKRSRELLPVRMLQADGVEVAVHPSSLTVKFVQYLLEGGQQGSQQGCTKDAFVAYHKKQATSRVFLHDCTVVPHVAILLFAGELRVSRKPKGHGGSKSSYSDKSCRKDCLVTVAGWIQFRMSELHAALYRRLQQEIEDLLRRKAEDPCCDVTGRQAVVVAVLTALVS